jgi:hypothetical protein
MKHAKRLACRKSNVSRICSSTGLLGQHAHNGVDMTIDLSDALEVSIYNLAA